MSNKVAKFASIITQPLNLYNFYLTIKGLSQEDNEVLATVQSTSFPSEKLRTIELWANGEIVRYPSIPQNDGGWKIKIPENDNGKIRSIFDGLKRKIYDQKTGTLIPPTMYDIVVVARDMQDRQVFKAILHGCWIQGREGVEMSSSDNQKSWEWDYNFVYQWIEDDE